MKKFLLLLLIITTASTSTYAVTSHDIHENVYLRQDVFEAKMDRFIAEIRLMNEQLRSELNSRIDTTNSRINVTEARIEELKTMVYWGIALLGILITLAAVAPSLVQVIKELSTQKFSLEDVEKLIDSKLQAKNPIRN